jgi:hypothetical protein
MAPDQEYQILAVAFSSFDDSHKLGGVDTAAGGIEKNFPRSRMPRKEIESLRDNLVHFAIGVT